MANNRDLNIRLNADATGFERGFKSAEASAKVFERELAKVEAAQRQMASFEAQAYREQAARDAKRSDSLARVGRSMQLMGLAAVAAGGVAVKSFADFDQAMSNVQAATHETAGNMALLRKAAIDAGKSTQYSATEAAGAIEELSKAGVSTADILAGGLSGAMNLAAAGGVDVGEAAETAASAMVQFGLKGKDVSHIADLLAAGAGKAQGSVSDLGMALNQSGLVASQMGLSIEESTGTLAAFASAGLIGSDAGTSFKTMLLSLANPSKEAAETMQQLGISAYDAQGQFIGTERLAGQLQAALGGLSQEQRDSALATIFGSDAIRAANVLYTQGSVGIAKWTGAVNDTGYAAETAATRMDNLKGDLEQLRGALETAFISSGEGASGVLRDLVQFATEAVDSFNELPEELQSAAAGTAIVAGGITALGGAALEAGQKVLEVKETMEGLGLTAGNLKTAFGKVSGFLGGPWGIAVVGAVALLGTFAASAYEAHKRQEELRGTLDQTTGAITDQTKALVAQNLQQDGTLRMARDLGLSLQTVTDAAMGNKDAIAELQAAYDAANTAQTKAFQQNPQAILDNNLLGNSAKDAATELNNQANGIASVMRATGASSSIILGAAADAAEVAEATGNAAGAATGLAEAQTVAANAAGNLSEAEIELRADLAESAASFVSVSSAYSEAQDDMQSAAKESAEAQAKASASTTDTWEDYAKDVSASFDSVIAKLEEQVTAQAEWERNMILLAGRVTEGTLDQLRNMGPEGAALVADLTHRSQAELDHFDDLTQQSLKSTTAGWAERIREATPLLVNAAANLGQETADNYRQRLADGTATTEQLMEEYAAAIKAKIPPVVNTDVRVNGVSAATNALFSVNQAITDIPNSKTVTLTTLVKGNLVGTTAVSRADLKPGDPGYGVLKAAGGPISGPGGPTDDAIPAWLSNGEYVIRASQTAKHRDLLDAINYGREGFATGGLVGQESKVNLNVPSVSSINQGVNTVLSPLARVIQAAADSLAEASDSTAVAGTGGTAAAGGQGSGWQWQIATLRKAFPGLALNSGYRAGSKTVSGNTSYHARGRAVDVPPRMDVFRWLLANYGNSPEIIYSPAGGSQIKNGKPHYYTGQVRSMHFNHVHWAYDQGGLARGKGFMPKLVNAPERVLSPAMTKDFERLVDLLGARAFADGGIVNRGTRTVQGSGTAISAPTISGSSRGGGLIIGQDASGNIQFQNGFDLGKYLARSMTPVKVTVDDSELRNANSELVNWTSRLNMANARLDEATAAAQRWDEELRNAGNDLEDAHRDVQNYTEDAARATKQLADSEKDLARMRKREGVSADDLADAEERVAEDRADLTKATEALTGAQIAVGVQTNRLTTAQEENAKAQTELNSATSLQASVAATAADATERQAEAERELNEAKAQALAYAQQIAATAMNRAEITGLFTEEDAARALKYAEAAYGASVAEAQAATDAGEYQAKIDQLAAAGQKLAAAQAAMGASYGTQKATIAGTRAEVEKLALSYGFTAQQARDLAESAVPLANSGQTLVDSLTRQLTAVQQFSQSVETLRALGLSQGLIEQILAAGPEKGLEVAQEIIAGGTDMVKKLNTVQAQLVAATNSLGQSAASASYGTTPALKPPAGITPLPQIIGNAPVISRGTRILKAGGGFVSGPGTGTSDSIPAYLSNGEYVVKAAAVAKYGDAFLDSVNAMRFAGGGLVARAMPAAGRPAQPIVVQVTGGGGGPQLNGPLIAVDTVRETVDVDLMSSRILTALGPLGLGGGR